MARPTLSVLIPNYNNGRESSRDGCRDLLGDLLESLLETLSDDPTGLEIIIADDGSTDDSLETARRWAERTWQGGPRRGEPFCRLIELEHCGVLSVVANRLTREAQGDYCCRLDGDIVVHTPCWAKLVVEAFKQGPPTLGIVGPKQLGAEGRVHAAGSWILHPRGHHHHGQGFESTALTRAVEIDHVMGCFYCHKRELWDHLGGYDETILRGQTVDLGLRARLEGWRTWFIPTIEYTHYHSERAPRANTADTRDSIAAGLARFESKWGFNRLAPDLDAVAERYAGTPLLWNARVFGPSTPQPPPTPGPVDVRNSEWSLVTTDEQFREALTRRLDIVDRLREGLDSGRRVLQVKCRGGLLCHLLARRDYECVGVDTDPNLVDLAQRVAAAETYPGPAPRFVHQPDPRRLPVEDGSADLVLLLEVLEWHSNPVGLLREAHRVLSPDGGLCIIARARRTINDDRDELHGYRAHELVMQVQSSCRFTPWVDEGCPDDPAALILFARRGIVAAPQQRTPEESTVQTP